VRATYGLGRYDLDTYDVGVALARSAVNLRSDMDQVTTALDALIADPTIVLDALASALDQVRANGRLSTFQGPTAAKEATDASRWRWGRQHTMDVASIAEDMLRDVNNRRAVGGTAGADYWRRMRNNIAPPWWAFYYGY